MFVNKTLLQKEGIKVPDNDWTWDDFYGICKAIVKDSDGDGQMDQFGCYDYTWLQAVYSNGITPFNQSGTSSNFLDEKFSQSLEFVKRLEATNRNYQVTSNDFDLGKVVFRLHFLIIELTCHIRGESKNILALSGHVSVCQQDLPGITVRR